VSDSHTLRVRAEELFFFVAIWFGNGKEKAGRTCVSVDEDDHIICNKNLKKEINTSSAKIACITVGMCACFQV
jgi:hypothetical protein